MNIAIVGSGIAGLTAAYKLHPKHHIKLFETNDYLGGHTATVDVKHAGKQYAVDTGFIVYNHKTYPQFCKLLEELGVAEQKSSMGFSVSDKERDFEYSGNSLKRMFAKKRHAVNVNFLRMLSDILRFNKKATALLGDPSDIGLGEFLKQQGYSQWFVDRYLLPMGGAIWSTSPSDMLNFPAKYLIQFFDNHGLLQIKDRPQWYAIAGGSKTYVEAMVKPFAEHIYLNTPVLRLRRTQEGVELTTHRGTEMFDKVIVAAHSDQALSMLDDVTALEQDVLGAFHYKPNAVCLHTDDSVLPKRKKCWAAWNYHMHDQSMVSLTYNMNILQNIKAPVTFCVTMNAVSAIDPQKIIATFDYAHPVMTPQSVNAQTRQRELNGSANVYYCGAYWRYGFHEDGVVSALQAVRHLEDDLG